MRQMLGLDRRRTALLLVDLQEEQRVDPLYAVDGFASVIGNARSVLAAARDNGVRVFHSLYRRDFALCPPRPFEPMTADGGATFSDKMSKLTDLCVEVAPVAGEAVIVKNDASVFSEASFHDLVRSADLEWLMVVGVWTEACVAATIRDAMAAGLRVMIVKDACGSGTQAMHETAVINLANRLYGGAIVDTVRAKAALAGEAVPAWVAERPVPILFNYANAAEHYRSL